MGYIKKEFQNKLQLMDSRYNDIPKNWNKFIEETRVNHNLIIKRKEGAICTNCKHEFKTKKRIGEYQKCPNCKRVLKLRKIKGTHTVKCPVCANHFNIKI